jgi:thiol-disulfide isomerase/thioredoxin
MNKLLAILLMAATPAWAAPAPQLPIRDFKAMPIVTMAPYDEKADAKAAVDAAFARAAKSHKRVLLDLGGNWCPDCIVLANFMRLPAMQTFIAAHYEVAMVDVGRFDKNLDIPARFGLSRKLVGVPTVLVAEPDGTLVNGGHIFALADSSHMTPAALADYLARWTN